jgi:cystathionine gamma-synthase
MPASPLDRSTMWPFEDGRQGRFGYARDDHPTGVEAEEALGALDGGKALLFPSGMGAVTTVALTMLGPGKTVALAEGSYYGHSLLFRHLARWGLELVEFDQTGPPPPGADLVFLEAPSNPLLTMPDLEAAAAHPAPVLCDATVSSPVFLRPLEHGCDLVLHSATKVLAGHDDVLAGAVCVRDVELHRRLHETRALAGVVASADTAWLLLRGLKTLHVRIERQTETARELARRLAEHPAVTTVRYPGFSYLISFDVRGGEEASLAAEKALRLIVNATSLGGTVSKIEGRHRREGPRCPEGLLRLSVGLEDVEALWVDLEQALARA